MALLSVGVCRSVLAAFLMASSLMASSACAEAQPAKPKRVILLHSYGRDFLPWSETARAVREALERQTRWPVDLMDQSLASARFGGENHEGPFVDYLVQLYANSPPDLIISLGAPAAAFVQRHRRVLFPGVPMLLTNVEQSRVQRSLLTENDTVVGVANDHLAIFESMLRVLPATTTVMVVIGNSPLEQILRGSIQRQLKPLEGRIKLVYTNDLSFDELLRSAAVLPSHSAIYWHMMVVDAAGVGHEGKAALSRLHAIANAPIFSYTDAYFGSDLLGGPMQSVAANSQQAASAAIRILAGEKPSDIKIPASGVAAPKYNSRELQRWGISESSLPSGSEIYFREPGAWERYRTQILAIFAALLVQGAMITWLLLERRRRHLAELESRSRLREVIHLDRVAAVGAMSASVSHELHQPLGAILANAETVELLLDATPIDLNQIKEILADIRHSDQRAVDIIAHLRGLLKKQGESELREFELNDVLRDALHTLEPEARKRGVLISADHVQGILLVRADRVHLEQVILNLATNAMDAMQDCAPDTRKMTVQTALAGDSEVEVSVSDTGTGIPNDKLKSIFETFYTTKQQGTGLGLSIVRTIVENCGGKVWAENRPGGGAVFRFTLPLTKALPA